MPLIFLSTLDTIKKENQTLAETIDAFLKKIPDNIQDHKDSVLKKNLRPSIQTMGTLISQLNHHQSKKDLTKLLEQVSTINILCKKHIHS